jgi:hypothetical protein
LVSENTVEIGPALLSDIKQYLYQYNQAQKTPINLTQNSVPIVHLTKPSPLSIVDKSIFWKEDFDLIDLSSLEFARQLTIWAAERCSQITKFDLLQISQDKKEEAPNSALIILVINNLKSWTICKILSSFFIGSCKEMIKKFVDLMRHLKKLRNFLHLQSIWGSFISSHLRDLLNDSQYFSQQDKEFFDTKVDPIMTMESNVFREKFENKEKPYLP